MEFRLSCEKWNLAPFGLLDQWKAQIPGDFSEKMPTPFLPGTRNLTKHHLLCCALPGIIACIEAKVCRMLSMNCSAVQRDVVRKLCHICDFGTIPLPRK